MNTLSLLVRLFLKVRFACLFLILLASCKQKYTHGDFTIIVEEDKYESLGGALKTNSYDLFYKGKEIDWSGQLPDIKTPEVWNWYPLENDPSALLVVVMNDYYLLRPAGERVTINRIGEASYRSGLFERQPYTELLNKGLFFHQAGRLVNLKNLHQDTLSIPPGGRFLAANNEASTIVYLNGVFEDDSDLEKTLKRGRDIRDGIYGYEPPVNKTTVYITEWNIPARKTSLYSYTDTTLWNDLNNYYDRTSYQVVATEVDSSFVFGLFKWAQDSAGTKHLIPKKALLTAIKFEDDSSARLPHDW